MKQNQIILCTLVLVIFLFGCVSTGEGSRVGVAPMIEVDNSLRPADVELSVGELEKISQAKRVLSDSGGHDFSLVYELVELNKNDFKKVVKICEEAGSSLHCLKKASQKNPRLRNQICPELEKKIRQDYEKYFNAEEMNKFVDGHLDDCRAGRPQYIR